MLEPFTRRTLLEAAGALLALPPERHSDRLGINCHLELNENAARKVLHAARQAGFRRCQLYFDWVHADEAFLRDLPGWVKQEGIQVEVLGAYVNCVAPGVLIMETRAQDLDRAIEFAPHLGAKRLTAWTGGYGPALFTSDERNFTPAASDAILRTIEPRFKRLEEHKVLLALESYITLACPDAPTLRRLLDRTPPFIGAVFDPPNLTPIALYAKRDAVLRDMLTTLKDRVAVVHWKDFRLAHDGRSYELPGPLDGVMNYSLFLDCVKQLPSDTPIMAEHISPDQYPAFYSRLEPLLSRALA